MSERHCPLCRGATTPCDLFDSVGSARFPKTAWGMERPGFLELTTTPRKRQSPVTQHVCVECGFIMAFAETPAVFRAELGEEEASAASLPLPHHGDDPPDR